MKTNKTQTAQATRRPGARKEEVKKECVVTVGTTQFEELVSVATSERFLAGLKEKGFTKLVMQVGSGALPRIKGREDEGIEEEGGGGGGGTSGAGVFVHKTGVQVECFRFKPEFAAVIAAADLVVSHAGSGSIFEALCAGRKLIVVVNTRLMHNHQRELADRLAADKYLITSDCDSLCDALDALDEDALVPYVPGDPAVRVRAPKVHRENEPATHRAGSVCVCVSVNVVFGPDTDASSRI